MQLTLIKKGPKAFFKENELITMQKIILALFAPKHRSQRRQDNNRAHHVHYKHKG